MTSAFAHSMTGAPYVPESPGVPVSHAFPCLLVSSLTPFAATGVSSKVPALEKETSASSGGCCCGQGVSAGEWDDLFGAVVARLIKAAAMPDQLPISPIAPVGTDQRTKLAAVVLECVEAMGLLRVMLAQQRHQALAVTSGSFRRL